MDCGDTDIAAITSNFIKRFRCHVSQYMQKERYLTALYWADKIVTLSTGLEGHEDDVLTLATCMYKSKQYDRAVHAVQLHQCLYPSVTGRYIAALCYKELGEYQLALDLLKDSDDKFNETMVVVTGHDALGGSITAHDNYSLSSSICVLRGELHEKKDNKELAADSYKAALEHDVLCFEALDSLIQHQMLKADEEVELFSSLPFSEQLLPDDIDIVKMLYKTRLKAVVLQSDKILQEKERNGCYEKLAVNVNKVPSSLYDNVDVMTMRAEKLYCGCKTLQGYKLCKQIQQIDNFNPYCLLVYIACLVELKKKTELFRLGHSLVRAYSEAPLSWYAVGCYYMLCGKMEAARRYFTKATNLNSSFAPAWLSFAHSFGYDNEHDQAVAAYFKAIQHLRGCHLAYLYIALEYTLTRNVKLAIKFLEEGETVANMDPMIIHEQAVIKYHQDKVSQALTMFKSVLSMVSESEGDDLSDKVKWEPLLNNLAHCYRKMKSYPLALEYHHKALTLIPDNPSTLCAIGFLHALNENIGDAILYFEKTLRVKSDDTLATNMLKRCMDLEVMALGLDPSDSFPDYPPATHFPLPAPASALVGSRVMDVGDGDGDGVVGKVVGEVVSRVEQVDQASSHRGQEERVRARQAREAMLALSLSPFTSGSGGISGVGTDLMESGLNSPMGDMASFEQSMEIEDIDDLSS